MKQTLNGIPVTRVRDARDGDPGFIKGSTDQVVATLEDGTQKTVKRTDIKDAE